MAAGWIRIKIPSGTVGADVADFPIYFKLGASCGTSAADLTAVFDALGANSLKIKLFSSDFTTQHYVEVVSWDSGGETAELHWKGSLLAASDNIFWLAYDSSWADNTTYVGVTGSTPGKAVWDSGFQAVFHMNDLTTSTIADSTTNGNTGAKASANHPVETAGLLGKAQNFNGTNTDYITKAAATLNLTNGGAITVEAQVYSNGLISQDCVFAERDDVNSEWIFGLEGGYPFARGAGFSTALKSSTQMPISSWQYNAMTINGTAGLLYLQGSQTKSATTDAIHDTAANKLSIGTYNAGAGWYINALFGELRISNVVRSADWINATNLTLTDALCEYTVALFPTSITSAEATGTARLDHQLLASGIVTAEAFGASRLDLQLTASGIATGEAIGTARLDHQLLASGIASGEAFGSHRADIQLLAQGIISAEQLGMPLLLYYAVRGSAAATDSAVATATASDSLIATAAATDT